MTIATAVLYQTFSSLRMSLTCPRLIWMLVILLPKNEICVFVRSGWSFYCFSVRKFWDVLSRKACFMLSVFYSHRRFWIKNFLISSPGIYSMAQETHYSTISPVLIFWSSMPPFHHSGTFCDCWVRSRVFSFI